MAIEITYAFTVPATVDRVARALCSEAYTLDGASARDDVESVTHRVIRDDDRGVEYEVLYVEYDRGRTGKINRGGPTHKARAWCLWDAAARTLRWTYSTEWSKRFSLEGIYRLTPRGESTHLDYHATIDVRIPFIGDQIAKLVGRGHEKDMPRLQALIARHATGPDPTGPDSTP